MSINEVLSVNLIEQKVLEGERALFKQRDLKLRFCTFDNGESPLKECSNIDIDTTLFKWKYPMWYGENFTLRNCTMFDMARAGIWYTSNIFMTDCDIQAPKAFRRTTGIRLENVYFSNADETLWHCKDVHLKNVVVAAGNYFGMNSSDMEIDGFKIDGNYTFDGCCNITVRNARMLSKDAFWNAENVTVYDSYISGEYLGWNSRNVRFVNCTIESLQGMCYMDNVVLEKCTLINTNLAFEYSTVKADVTNTIDSIKNPVSGIVKAGRIMEVIFDDPEIEPSKTTIIHE